MESDVTEPFSELPNCCLPTVKSNTPRSTRSTELSGVVSSCPPRCRSLWLDKHTCLQRTWHIRLWPILIAVASRCFFPTQRFPGVRHEAIPQSGQSSTAARTKARHMLSCNTQERHRDSGFRVSTDLSNSICRAKYTAQSNPTVSCCYVVRPAEHYSRRRQR